MLTIVRGLPGSGKSTLAKKLAGYSGTHIEADQFWMKDGVYVFDASRLAEAHADCLARTRESLVNTTFPVFVSNTFTTRKEYQPYIDLAVSLGVKYQVIDVHGNFGSIHDVPQHTLDAMRTRWQSHV